MTPAELTDAINAVRSTLDQIERAFPAAYEAQWERSPSAPTPRDDTSERGKGGPISDPTFDIVADERRLALRAEIRRHEAFLAWADRGARKLDGRLCAALDAWEGEER